MKKTLLTFLFIFPVILTSCGETTFSVHTKVQQDYLSGDPSLIFNYANGNLEISQPEKFVLDFSNAITNDNASFCYSENSSFDDPIFVPILDKKVHIDNLKINTMYYYRLSFDGKTIKEGNFRSSDKIIRNLNIKGVSNARDMGGYVTEDGKTVKQGLLFRNGKFDDGGMVDGNFNKTISDEGLSVMKNILKIKTEIDFRISDFDYPEVLPNRGIDTSVLGNDVKYYHTQLRWMPNLPAYPLDKNEENTVKIFNILSDKNNYPISYHCSVGTDRTGFISYLLGAVLGISERNLEYDYCFSNFGNIANPKVLDGKGRSVEDLKYTIVDDVNEQPGNSLKEKSQNFLLSLGVSQSSIDSFRDIMLEK